MNNIIDCKGLQCPIPVVKTKKYFDSIQSGESTVIVDNLVAKNNIVKLSEGSGYKSIVEEKDGLYSITITKDECEVANALINENKKFTLVVSTDKLGLGNDKLGEILMKSYIFALSEADLIPNDYFLLMEG